MNPFYQEISENIEYIAQFGGDEEGGVTRLLYTQEWIDAQKALSQKFIESGLIPTFDEVGNLSGIIKGKTLADEIIATGSHVDTVVSGGRLDGTFGIIAGYLAVKKLVEKYGQPKRSIEVISFAEEEGSRFPYTFWGSKNYVGSVDAKEVEQLVDKDGISFTTAMNKAGFNFKKNLTNKNDNIKAFVELHIEQGGVLEKNHQAIGVVTSIVGQRRYSIHLKGEANHAGTTPMSYRKDAVYGYAKIVNKCIDMAFDFKDPMVVTFGQAQIIPNVGNVVPKEVLFSMDCRHTDESKLKDNTDKLIEIMEEVAKQLQLEIEINCNLNAKPVAMDEKLVASIIDACDKNNLNYRLMHSGAGHDTQIMASKVASAMLFVPSIKGVSHNPAESTKVEDLAQGIEALMAVLYDLAY